MPPGGSLGRREPREDARRPDGPPPVGAFVFARASERGCRSVGAPPLPSGPAGPETSPPGRVAPARGHFDAAPARRPPSGGAPHLDTLGTSRHPIARTRDSAVRGAKSVPRIEWLRRLEALTVDHRERKAQALEAESRRRVRRALHAGATPKTASLAGKWHKQRAEGQRYRFANAVNCGEGPTILEATCEACGNVTEHPLTCGATLVCIACRGRLQAKRRANVGNGQRVVMHRGKLAGLLRRNRRGGRWSDKFITLTIPHLPEHTIGDRIALIHTAWPHFLKAFNAWLRETEPHVHQFSTWYGSHEWTVGHDEKGHPHVQLWFFGPFVDADLSDLWRTALEKAGLGIPTEENGRTRFRWEGDVITDVREAKDVRGGVYELVKYVWKDIVADGDFVRPQ